MDFETLTAPHRRAIEAYVKFKVSEREDAQDILQETWLTAYLHFSELRDPTRVKPWLLSIARSRMNDYFRAKARKLEIPLEELEETISTGGLLSHEEKHIVHDVLERLRDHEKQILYLYYFKDLPQEEIARRLQVPLGTVKSRLHYAKEKFRKEYES